MANEQVVAVVGATGAVGQTTLKLLEDRNFPVRDIRLLASARSVGKKMTFKGEQIPVQEVTAESFKGIDFAFFSAGGEQSKKFAQHVVKAGAIMIDKSSAFRMDAKVPLVVPEINGASARKHQGIVSCPNCTTIVTVMPLKPLHDAGKLKRVVATSFQAVSGAGVGGIEELRSQTMAWSKGEKPVAKFFQHQIAFNLLPAGDIGEGGYTGEETKLINEMRKILDLPELPICPTTVRVPVFTTHSISVNAETERHVTAAQAREVMGRFPGLRVYDDPAQNRYPMPIIVEGQDDCFVGRIREDISTANGINFWVVGDQLRKGAALNGIQIAELLLT
jgi:aspartate-semialdehyde dehydrogenase